MGILRGIWFYLVLIFPFGVAFVMGVITSYMVKLHFYDKQKYHILNELYWIKHKEISVKEKIEKEISSDTVTMLVCMILLFVYFNFEGEINGTINVVLIISFLFGLGGDTVKQKTSMEEFIKEYNLDVELEDLKKSTH